MAKAVRVPQLGLMMEGGTLLRWRKADGDAVRPGEVLFELETDKATVEVEAEAAGYLRGIALAEGDYAAVGTQLAWIAATPDEPLEPEPDSPEEPASPQGWPAPPGAAAGPAGGSVGVPPAAAPASPGRSAPEATPQPAPWPPTPYPPAQPLQSAPALSASASPYARRLAREAGLDWTSLAGSGPGGRVVARDVRGAAAAGPSVAVPSASVPAASGSAGAPAPFAAPPATGDAAPMRAAIARRTALIAQVPLFWAVRTIEMVRVREALASAAGRWPVRPTYTDFFLQACLLGLARAPRIHGRFRDGRAEPYAAPAIGLAVLVPGGLLVPVLRPRPDATLRELAEMRAGLVARARSGRLAVADMGDPTFTLSNLGSLGVEGFQALPDPAAAAALAVGAVVDRPAVREGAVVALPVCAATLTLDHRVADGADAAAFLGALAAYCEGGEGLRLD